MFQTPASANDSALFIAIISLVVSVVGSCVANVSSIYSIRKTRLEIEKLLLEIEEKKEKNRLTEPNDSRILLPNDEQIINIKKSLPLPRTNFLSLGLLLVAGIPGFLIFSIIQNQNNSLIEQNKKLIQEIEVSPTDFLEISVRKEDNINTVVLINTLAGARHSMVDNQCEYLKNIKLKNGYYRGKNEIDIIRNLVFSPNDDIYFESLDNAFVITEIPDQNKIEIKCKYASEKELKLKYKERYTRTELP